MCIIMSPVPILVCTNLFINCVEDWCKSCVNCATKKSLRHSKGFPLLSSPVEGAFGTVAVDILGPFKPSDIVIILQFLVIS